MGRTCLVRFLSRFQSYFSQVLLSLHSSTGVLCRLAGSLENCAHLHNCKTFPQTSTEVMMTACFPCTIPGILQRSVQYWDRRSVLFDCRNTREWERKLECIILGTHWQDVTCECFGLTTTQLSLRALFWWIGRAPALIQALALVGVSNSGSAFWCLERQRRNAAQRDANAKRLDHL